VLRVVPVLHVTLVQRSKTQCQPGVSCSCGLGSALLALTPSPDFISGLYGRAAVPFDGMAVQPQAINRVGHNMSTNIKPAGLWGVWWEAVGSYWVHWRDFDVPFPQFGRATCLALVNVNDLRPCLMFPKRSHS